MPRQKPFPSKETDLNAYFARVVPYLLLHFSRLHVSESNITAVNTALDAWISIFPLARNENLRSKLIIANKNSARDSLITLLRSIYADIPQSILTAQDRITFGLDEKNTSRSLNPKPTTHPIGKININNRLQHTISYTDQDGSIGKPHGVRGCQIWFTMDANITSQANLRYLASSSVSPYVHKFDVPDVGKTVQYWLRWENTRGETGPWSPVLNAIVNG